MRKQTISPAQLATCDQLKKWVLSTNLGVSGLSEICGWPTGTLRNMMRGRALVRRDKIEHIRCCYLDWLRSQKHHAWGGLTAIKRVSDPPLGQTQVIAIPSNQACYHTIHPVAVKRSGLKTGYELLAEAVKRSAPYNPGKPGRRPNPDSYRSRKKRGELFKRGRRSKLDESRQLKLLSQMKANWHSK